MKTFLAAATLSLLSSLAMAQATPAGLWRTIDEARRRVSRMAFMI